MLRIQLTIRAPAHMAELNESWRASTMRTLRSAAGGSPHRV